MIRIAAGRARGEMGAHLPWAASLLAASALLFACSIPDQGGPGPGSQSPDGFVSQAADQVADTFGTFRPTGPPDQPLRVPVGDRCVVDLKQEYALEGALAGRMQVDFRIFVEGPCGAPPGMHNEHWIAHGDYSVEVDGETLPGSLVYLATVEAGGRVDGTIGLDGRLNGLLEVRGGFADGFMRYRGNLRRDTATDAAASTPQESR